MLNEATDFGGINRCRELGRCLGLRLIVPEERPRLLVHMAPGRSLRLSCTLSSGIPVSVFRRSLSTSTRLPGACLPFRFP